MFRKTQFKVEVYCRKTQKTDEKDTFFPQISTLLTQTQRFRPPSLIQVHGFHWRIVVVENCVSMVTTDPPVTSGDHEKTEYLHVFVWTRGPENQF